MNKIITFLLAAVFMIMLGCSSSSPQDKLNEIDKLVRKGFPLTLEQKESVTTLVTEGKILLEQGREKESSEILSQALDVLHIAEDADIFNKAD
jgi:polyhydroxyalkanoate synthesis regulator phasin